MQLFLLAKSGYLPIIYLFIHFALLFRSSHLPCCHRIPFRGECAFIHLRCQPPLNTCTARATRHSPSFRPLPRSPHLHHLPCLHYLPRLCCPVCAPTCDARHSLTFGPCPTRPIYVAH